MRTNKIVRLELEPSQYDRLMAYANLYFPGDVRKVNRALVHMIEKETKLTYKDLTLLDGLEPNLVG